MKRDIDLCRAILLAVEADKSRSISLEQLQEKYGELLGEYCTEELVYHCELMEEANLLAAAIQKSRGSVRVVLHRMTWSGHEFLDACRDDKRWQEAKTIGGKARDWTFSTVSQILAAISTQAWQDLVAR